MKLAERWHLLGVLEAFLKKNWGGEGTTVYSCYNVSDKHFCKHSTNLNIAMN